jgi:hypothetical protein
MTTEIARAIRKYRIRDLVYGVSGSGKTSWWLQIAIYLWEHQQLRSRWYLGDGGQQTLNISGCEDFVEIMNYNLWDHPLEVTQKICEGYWPKDPNEPNSILLPTDRATWQGIGMCVYEGTTVMSDYIMGDRIGGLAHRMSKGEMLNQDKSFMLKDGDLTFGGNARTHYGFTQRRILDVIERTRALPCHVGWTGHERKVDDEDYKEVWIGPDISGKALTTKIGASFGNTIHLHQVKAVRKGTDPMTKKAVESVIVQRRAYTRTHYDPEGSHFVKYYANTRLHPRLAEANPDFVPEFVLPDPLTYYGLLEKAAAEGMRLSAAAPSLSLNI